MAGTPSRALLISVHIMSPQPYGLGPIIPTRMPVLSYREGECLFCGQTASKQKNQDLNPIIFAPESKSSTSVLDACVYIGKK